MEAVNEEKLIMQPLALYLCFHKPLSDITSQKKTHARRRVGRIFRSDSYGKLLHLNKEQTVHLPLRRTVPKVCREICCAFVQHSEDRNVCNGIIKHRKYRHNEFTARPVPR